jgi:hypothetical protein
MRISKIATDVEITYQIKIVDLKRNSPWLWIITTKALQLLQGFGKTEFWHTRFSQWPIREYLISSSA